MLTKDMKVKPCGTTILVEIIPVEDTYEGSVIQRPTNETKRETGGRDIGRVLEIGAYAYKEWGLTHKDWGYEVGDVVEFKRYDGKAPRISETFDQFKNYRYITDNDIIGVYKQGESV